MLFRSQTDENSTTDNTSTQTEENAQNKDPFVDTVWYNYSESNVSYGGTSQNLRTKWFELTFYNDGTCFLKQYQGAVSVPKRAYTVSKADDGYTATASLYSYSFTINSEDSVKGTLVLGTSVYTLIKEGYEDAEQPDTPKEEEAEQEENSYSISLSVTGEVEDKRTVTVSTSSTNYLDSITSAKANTCIYINYKTSNGYALDLKVLQEDGTEISVNYMSFIMPESDITVTAKFIMENEWLANTSWGKTINGNWYYYIGFDSDGQYSMNPPEYSSGFSDHYYFVEEIDEGYRIFISKVLSPWTTDHGKKIPAYKSQNYYDTMIITDKNAETAWYYTNHKETEDNKIVLTKYVSSEE